MKNLIIDYYKNSKGTMKSKCLYIAKMINVDLEFCSREYMESRTRKNVTGTADGAEILLIRLKDKFDLFTFFHEVGHVLLHFSTGLNADDYYANKDKYETEADGFAEECLLAIFGDSVLDIIRICKI